MLHPNVIALPLIATFAVGPVLAMRRRRRLLFRLCTLPVLIHALGVLIVP